MSYKRIIVAVDGSKTSELALMDAIYLSKSLQSTLSIVYIADIFPINNLALGVDFDRYQQIIRDDGLAILERMKGIAEKDKLTAETMLVEIADVEKKISEKIVEFTISQKADLLVMGTHGRRGFKRFILGSVAEETIRISSIPVLLVRGQDES